MEKSPAVPGASRRRGSSIPTRAGLIHLTGQRCVDEASGDYWRLRCVLCEAVMPERHQGISQDVWVCVSDARSGGRAVFHMELRDGVIRRAPLAIGPMIYHRCDAATQPLEGL